MTDSVIEKRHELNRIVQAVSRVYGVSPDQILGDSRREEVAYARRIAMWFARQNVKESYPALGRFFRRDHSTVLMAVRCVDEGAYAEDIRLVSHELEFPQSMPRRCCEDCRSNVATINRLRAELADCYAQMDLRRTA